jgi:hypothetical protein
LCVIRGIAHPRRRHLRDRLHRTWRHRPRRWRHRSSAARGAYGVLTGGAHNRVVANGITASVGLGVLVQTSVNDHGSDNRILDNVVEGNGIQVNPGQASAQIAGNTIRHAGFAGIAAFEPSTIIERNTSSDNRGVGILAPNGAVDRGGNGATGNGQQPECVGVVCAG